MMVRHKMDSLYSTYILYKGRLRTKIAKHIGREKYTEIIKSYAGKKILMPEEANQFIYEGLVGNKPFMACRFGSTELNAVGTYYFKRKDEYEKEIKHVCFYSGFFPEDTSLGEKFSDLLIDTCKVADYFSVWYMPYEDYFVRKFTKPDSKIGYLTSFEPWKAKNPWTKALKGKKVLLIHPFDESIRAQYQKREGLFENPDILPEFDLKTLKAVQTLADNSDVRFKDWFEALDYMYDEAMKIDFDIAILGCGAYGMPLAGMLKKAGKKAIHLGGVTQILFGIKGKRWEEADEYRYIKELMNENWNYPLESEKPKSAQKIEGNCYWG